MTEYNAYQTMRADLLETSELDARDYPLLAPAINGNCQAHYLQLKVMRAAL